MSDREKQPGRYEMKVCPRCGEEKLIRKTSRYCSHSCAHWGNRNGTGGKGIPKPAARGPRPHLRRTNNGAWKGDSAGYMAMHARVWEARGKASANQCACGKRALDWANLTGVYSDIDDYEAMCRSCHIRYDRARRAETWTKIAS